MSQSYGKLCVVNKDGSFGSSVEIKKAMVFGSSNPANIRIKSKNIIAEHARVDVDENGDCFLIPLTDKHEPKINSIKIKTRSVLASNDRISIGGRVFIFNNAGSTTKVCAKAVHVREVSPATQKSVEKDLFGQLSLVQTNGSQEGAVVKIRGTMTIGREYPSTFRIKSPYVSKQHLKIVVNNNSECVLTHLSKTNRPIINGVEKQSAVLKNGDTISVGDFVLTYSSTCPTDSSSGNISPKLEDVAITKKNKLTNNTKRSTRKDTLVGYKENSRNRSNTRTEKNSTSVQGGTTAESIINVRCEESPFVSFSSTTNQQESDTNTIHGENSLLDENNSNKKVPATINNEIKDVIHPSAQSLQAMRSDTQTLLPSGRPSMETMMAQWEFMRDQFLGSSDEALEWLMLSKTGGVEAYKHAKRKTQLAEDQYFKSLFDIDLLENKKKLINQELAQLFKDLSNQTNFESNLHKLRLLCKTNLHGICSKQLSNHIEQFLVHPEKSELLEVTIEAYKGEMKILSERLHRSQVASDESLGEMEKWGEREKKTTAYREAMIADDVQWIETQKTANANALADMREFIPPNISQLSVSDFTNVLSAKGGFYSHALCSELKKNKLLQLVVMHPEDISKLNFLVGNFRQYFLDLDLDIVEMRAIRACLPDSFDLDKDGRKAEWREHFIAQLKQLVARESGELVKGGWDPDAGKRVHVRLPALQATEKRRRIYFYETPLELQNQLARYEKQENLLASKKQLLVAVEQQHAEFKLEYDTILSESRNPVYQQQYGMSALSLAKETAKKDFNESGLRKKNILLDISRIETSISTASLTKEDVLLYIRCHKEMVQDWESDRTDRLPIKGVFERQPVVDRLAKVTAVFATAEEEAASRQSELMSLQKRSTTNMPQKKEFNNCCCELTKTNKVQINSATLQTLNNIFQKEAQQLNKTIVSKQNTETTISIRPIKSKNLQKIVKNHVDAAENISSDSPAGHGLASLPPPPRASPQLSFLDQLKNRKKNSPK